MARMKDLVEQLEVADKLIADQRTEIENARATIEGLGQDLDKLAGNVSELTNERRELQKQLDDATVWEGYCKRIFEAFYVPRDGPSGYRRMMQLADHGRQLRVDRLTAHARDYVMATFKEQPFVETIGTGRRYAERMEELRENWLHEPGPATLVFGLGGRCDLHCSCGTVTNTHTPSEIIICSSGCGAAFELVEVTVVEGETSQDIISDLVLKRVAVPKPDSPHMHLEVETKSAPPAIDIETTNFAISSEAVEQLEAPPPLDTSELPESVKQKLDELRKTPWGQALDTMECPTCKSPLRPKDQGVLECTRCNQVIYRDPPDMTVTTSDDAEDDEARAESAGEDD